MSIDVDGAALRLRATGEVGATLRLLRDGQMLGEAALVDGSSDLVIDLVEDGNYALELVAVDAAGNASEPTRRTVTVDTTPPSPPAIVLTGGTVDEPMTTVRVDVDGATSLVVGLQGPEAPPDLRVEPNETSEPVPLPPGTWTITATATDDAANVSTTEVQHVVAVPEFTGTPLLSVPERPRENSRTLSVEGPAGGTGTLSVDGQDYHVEFDENGFAEVTVTNLSDGDHPVQLRVVDAFGRTVSEGELERLFVDTTPPAMSISGTDASLDIELEVGSTAQVWARALGSDPMRVDDGTLQLDLPSGTHELRFVATDEHGNTLELLHDVTVLGPLEILAGLGLMGVLGIGVVGGGVFAVHRGRRTRLLGAPPAADWYPSPEDDDLDAYWDGQAWTGERRPAPPVAAT